MEYVFNLFGLKSLIFASSLSANSLNLARNTLIVFLLFSKELFIKVVFSIFTFKGLKIRVKYKEFFLRVPCLKLS
ncbi:hypothetical protein DS746_p02 (plasmid) [Campylobacter jejuni]|nr:hypothetical protein DS746_p02 [Campylobacter jejuni]